jgi:SAM-dependent methyltransferase
MVDGGSRHRDRLYGRYVSARQTPPAPATLDGLTPRRPHLRALVRRHFPDDRAAAILDLGCGHGALLHFAAEAGYRNLAGVDASPEQVAAAHRLGLSQVRQGDLMAALKALPDASQDVVVAFDVVEHLARDEALDMADEARRVLKPGGRWIIHAPNGCSPFCGAVRYGDLTHELAFTPQSLAQLALNAGFRSVACHEDAPVVHGVRSFARAALWRALRAALRFYLAVETGSARGAVLTQNLLAVAVK